MREIRERMSKIEDPRHQSYVKHSLADILIIIMCGVLSGLDTLGDLVIYAKSKQEFLSNVLEVRQIPSKATFARVLNLVDGKKIGEAILDILRERFGTAGEVIAVDGKAICGTAKPDQPHTALQILSAYITESGVVLAQEAIHEKTNEIPVFQEMLTYLDVKGKTVTADAMHCQRETCRKVIQGKGDYLFDTSKEISYYISSLDDSPERLMALAREHWKIESMHWLLDVTFSEDKSRLLCENANRTMNALRKFALAVHKNFLMVHHSKTSIKAHMLSTLLNSDRLLELLRFL